MKPRYLTAKDAAAYMGVGRPTLALWAREGKIIKYRIAGSHSIRYAVAELDALVIEDARETAGAQ